jgi:hypothetical protein
MCFSIPTGIGARTTIATALLNAVFRELANNNPRINGGTANRIDPTNGGRNDEKTKSRIGRLAN